MTGVGHYLRAQELLQEARDSSEELSTAEYGLSVAVAQAHATLALAAATALGTPNATTEDNLAWLEAASEWKNPS
jgi:hypothetical protein